MKIFFITQRVPYPPDRGDKITTFNEINHLAKDHEVHVFCLAEDEDDLENTERLSQYVDNVTAVQLSQTMAKVRSALSLLFAQPISVAYFNKKKLHRAIKEQFFQIRPDLILAYSSGVAQYAEALQDVPRIMQFADLDSLKWKQYAQKSKGPMKFVYALEAKRLLAYEKHIANTFSHSLVCTKNEKADFEKLIPGASVSCVSNGVDLEYFKSAKATKKPASLVFTGVMDYYPNVDGVIWFVERILPLIKEKVPDVHFTICGSKPSPKVRELGSYDAVTVTGRVPDVRPYLDKAEVAVVPLRLARGIQNKLLEAMAMGLPCVSTTPAWAGIDIPKGDGVFVADEAREFAESVFELLLNQDLRTEMAIKARNGVEAKYTWDTQLKLLDKIIDIETGNNLVS